MNRLLWLVAAVSLMLADTPAVARQGDAPRYRQISARESKFQQELNAAAADGYRVIAGNAATQFALLERVADGTKRSYLFASAVELFLDRKKLEPGYRLVRPLFAADEFWASAVFERVGDDDRRYEYKVLKAGSPKGLRRKMEEQRDSGFGLVALSIGKDAVAIYEAGAPSGDSTLIFGDGGEIQKQFASDTTYCVIDGDGTKEAVYAVRPCPTAEAASAYEWLATTKPRRWNASSMRLRPGGWGWCRPVSLASQRRRRCSEAHTTTKRSASWPVSWTSRHHGATASLARSERAPLPRRWRRPPTLDSPSSASPWATRKSWR